MTVAQCASQFTHFKFRVQFDSSLKGPISLPHYPKLGWYPAAMRSAQAAPPPRVLTETDLFAKAVVLVFGLGESDRERALRGLCRCRRGSTVTLLGSWRWAGREWITACVRPPASTLVSLRCTHQHLTVINLKRLRSDVTALFFDPHRSFTSAMSSQPESTQSSCTSRDESSSATHILTNESDVGSTNSTIHDTSVVVVATTQIEPKNFASPVLVPDLANSSPKKSSAEISPIRVPTDLVTSDLESPGPWEEDDDIMIPKGPSTSATGVKRPTRPTGPVKTK